MKSSPGLTTHKRAAHRSAHSSPVSAELNTSAEHRHEKEAREKLDARASAIENDPKKRGEYHFALYSLVQLIDKATEQLAEDAVLELWAVEKLIHHHPDFQEEALAMRKLWEGMQVMIKTSNKWRNS